MGGRIRHCRLAPSGSGFCYSTGEFFIRSSISYLLLVSQKTKLFLIIWAAGLLGVLSFLLVDLGALIASLPLPAGTEVPFSVPVLKILSLIQPAVIVAVASLTGVMLAPKVGLSSPVAEAAANSAGLLEPLRPQIVSGLLGGLAGGVAVVSIAALFNPFLPSGAAERISGFGELVPLATRILYGGITEEVLLRWGFMTLLVWAAWRILQKGKGSPTSSHFVGAIITSSVVFGVGHLPIAYLLFPEKTLALTLFVVIGNSAFGLIAGFLFWKRGLESAIIAHMLTHIILFTASYFGAYF